MSIRTIEQIADAVLYEGYVLYPYRASAAKNQFRWQVGLVTPRAYAEATGSDPWFMQTECVAETAPGATLSVKVRALHVQHRAIEEALEPNASTWSRVPTLSVGDRQLIEWDEAVASEFVRDGLAFAGRRQEWSETWTLDASHEIEYVHDHAGRLAGRLVRRRQRVTSVVQVSVEPFERLMKIRVRLENVSACPARTLAERPDALRQSIAGTHTVLTIKNGGFLSLLEPPSFAAALASSCTNVHTWPVLVGAAGDRQSMLSSPVILYDYPTVAAESPVELCDATEIDEMLMLRVRTLTDDEKREARATDSRAAAIIEHASAASRDEMQRLHGAIRHYGNAPPPKPELTCVHVAADLQVGLGGPEGPPLRIPNTSELRRNALEAWQEFLNPAAEAPPEAAYLEIGSIRVGSGSRVRLKPTHRADSIDICLDGRLATVTGIHTTVEDKTYVAVMVDDDPIGAVSSRYRRSFFFHPDEIVPLETRGDPAR